MEEEIWFCFSAKRGPPAVDFLADLMFNRGREEGLPTNQKGG
jgi:hypothetical protein